ncbi:hypothetical protein A6R68_15620, partial [Neotoma lepida]
VRSSDVSWSDTRRTLRKDHRWESGSLLEREEKEKLFNEHIEALTKKKREHFRQLLDETSATTLMKGVHGRIDSAEDGSISFPNPHYHISFMNNWLIASTAGYRDDSVISKDEEKRQRCNTFFHCNCVQVIAQSPSIPKGATVEPEMSERRPLGFGQQRAGESMPLLAEAEAEDVQMSLVIGGLSVPCPFQSAALKHGKAMARRKRQD